jgi:hypothetical protein
MAATTRPSSLVVGWAGAWGLNVRRVLVALRDRGPLTVTEIARVLRFDALHADLTSGHNLGPDHGARMLAHAILEDAADILITDGDRYSIAADTMTFTSPFDGRTLRLLTADEQADAKAEADAVRPVRRWNSAGLAYRRYGGKWADGQLPYRKHDPDDVKAMADAIGALGWLPGSRIVKDQHGVIIEGHLRADSLGLLDIDPDTGTTPLGEPYVEIRAFNNDAARLLFALTANWSTLNAKTRKAISHQVFGDETLTLEVVTRLLTPLADVMSAPLIVNAPPTSTNGDVMPPIPDPGRLESAPARVPKGLNDDDLDLLAQIGRHGFRGATYKELDADNHGPITARLARLVDGDHIVKLNQKRLRSSVYVTPEWQQGRPEGKPRRSRVAPAPPPPPKPPIAYTNAAVAAMTWEQAAQAKWVHSGSGRIYASTGARANAPVADHIDGLIDNLTAAAPWLLPMICERLHQRRG